MKLVLVGRVAGGFGVRGELRITTYTEDPLALLRYRELRDQNGAVVLILQSARAVKDGVIAKIEALSDKTAADALRGVRLHVPRDALPPPAEEEFYHADLIGLRAQTTGGETLGEVKAVHDFGAGDVLEIGPTDGRPGLYLPFTREVVPVIDIAGRRIVVSPPLEVEADGEPPAANPL